MARRPGEARLPHFDDQVLRMDSSAAIKILFVFQACPSKSPSAAESSCARGLETMMNEVAAIDVSSSASVLWARRWTLAIAVVAAAAAGFAIAALLPKTFESQV